MISIIIPYNKDRGWLNAAIQSCKDQTDQDFELIISKGNGTQSENFNKGLAQVKRKYVHILHEDDLLPLQFVEQVKRILEAEKQQLNPVPDLICGAAVNFTEKNKSVFFSAFYDFKSLLADNTIHGGTCVYSADILRHVGGMRQDLVTGEEYDMNLRLIKAGANVLVVSDVLKFYRMQGQNKSLTHKGFASMKERRKYIEDKIINIYKV